MAAFEPGDIVRVPFPYTNRETTQHRPALVISDGSTASDLLIWVLMITSTANRGWPGDVVIESSADLTGLPAPSMVRTLKVATIETSSAERIGAVAASELAAVRQELTKILSLR